MVEQRVREADEQKSRSGQGRQGSQGLRRL